RALTDFIDQLGPLTGNVANLDNNKKYIAGNTGVYYRQSLVTGQTLLEVLREPNITVKQKLNLIKPVVDLCIEVCGHIRPEDGAPANAEAVFKLSPIDVG